MILILIKYKKTLIKNNKFKIIKKNIFSKYYILLKTYKNIIKNLKNLK